MSTVGAREDEGVTQQFPRKAVQLKVTKEESEEGVAAKFATLFTSPALAACRVISAGEARTSIGEQVDIPCLLAQLEEQGLAVNRGDMSKAEAMLMNQATALQSLFARLTEKAMGSECVSSYEAYLRLALRAQSQSRATLEALSAIKNPPFIYAKQLNQTTGPQQINNTASSRKRTRKSENQQTQLSEDTNELYPHTRTSGVTRPADPTMEAVGKVDRSKDCRR
jgi:hypothetical protein